MILRVGIDKIPPAEELPVGARVSEPGMIGQCVKYGEGTWAQTYFDHGDRLLNCILAKPGVTVEIPDADPSGTPSGTPSGSP